MEDFKNSIYWGMFTDMVTFMRESYSMDSSEKGYTEKVADRYCEICKKYENAEGYAFFCRMMSGVAFELQRIHYESER